MKVHLSIHPQLRRFLRLACGFFLLPLGVVMLILPGPGLPIVLLSLGLLAGDFVWARRLLMWVQRQVSRASDLVPPRLTRRLTNLGRKGGQGQHRPTSASPDSK